MQRAYLAKLMELAEKDPRVLHLVADSGTGFDEMFRRNFPDQMLNFGIAEEEMVAAAAGLATADKIPFVYTAGAFLAYRSLEFIRDDVCFQNLNVKIVGMGSGLAWCSLGPTHHTTEDIAVLRGIPNLTILSPATPIQVAACVDEAYALKGPVYIRIGMNNEREYFQEGYELPLNRQEVLNNGKDVLIFSTGSILEETMEASELLENEGISCTVISVTGIKPFDQTLLMNYIDSVKLIVSVEEHNIYGGLGSIIAECMTEKAIGKKLLRIGLNDVFAVGYGKEQREVRKENGLDSNSIAEKIKRSLVHE